MIDLKALAKKARPAVLLLTISDSSGKEIATGTGFLVSSDGKLITNHHVIENGASAVAKTESGSLFPVEGVLASDAKNDLVVLKLKGKDLPFLVLGNNDKIEVGTRIAVIGSPLGLEGTLSEGIISGTRNLMSDIHVIQLTAAISSGSSGSPVLNAEGIVVGIASSLLRGGQALNFAVPADAAIALITKTDKTRIVQSLGTHLAGQDNVIYSDPDWRASIRAEAAQDYGEALKHVQALAKRYPENDSAWFNLGFVYSNLGFNDDAIAAFRQAIKTMPDDFFAWYRLGICLWDVGHKEDAIAAFRQVIKINPDYAVAWFALGNYLKKLDRRDDAIAAFQQAIKLQPDYALSREMLGDCLWNAGRKDEAIAAYRQAIKIKPDDADAWHNLGFYLQESGQIDKARDALRHADSLKQKILK